MAYYGLSRRRSWTCLNRGTGPASRPALAQYATACASPAGPRKTLAGHGLAWPRLPGRPWPARVLHPPAGRGLPGPVGRGLREPGRPPQNPSRPWPWPGVAPPSRQAVAC
eukprot:scaffold21493_cov107-Isochrysis_galbana.AAC.6